MPGLQNSPGIFGIKGEKRMEQLERIIIGGKSFPIKIDLNVLEKIQNDFGTINEFERKILGLNAVKDGEGKVLFENDKPVMMQVEPSITAIKAVLPTMINEGLAIEAEEQNRSWEPVSDRFVFENCKIPFDMLAEIIHKEFSKCFETKKG